MSWEVAARMWGGWRAASAQRCTRAGPREEEREREKERKGGSWQGYTGTHVCGPRDQLEGRRADQGALDWPSIPILGMMELRCTPTSGTSVHPFSEAARVHGKRPRGSHSGLAASGLAGSGWLALAASG